MQYARTLKEMGVETKIIVFPEDMHGLDKLVVLFNHFTFVTPISVFCVATFD